MANQDELYFYCQCILSDETLEQGHVFLLGADCPEDKYTNIRYIMKQNHMNPLYLLLPDLRKKYVHLYEKQKDEIYDKKEYEFV